MRMSNKQKTVLRRSVALIMAIPAVAWTSAYAQSGDTEGAAPQIEKVVVTARRRAELIQDVPGAVSSISGAELDKQAIPDITVLSETMPSTTLKSSRGTNTTLTAFIRGVGQQDPVAGYEQGVGIYLDDIYLVRPQGALTDIYDLERIEVLRGPQGTLYGRNTIGGAIKYVTRKLAPKTTFDAKATFGNYGEKDLVLKASTPISDMLRVGGTIGTFNHNGYGHNVITGQDNYNKKVVAGRLSVELMPNSDLFVRLATDRTVDDSNPKQGYRLTPGPAPTNLPVLTGDYDTRANLYTVLGHKQQVITQGTSLLAEYQINPALSIKSITAYRKSKSYAPIDFDSLNSPLFEAPAIYSDNQKSQEFQLTYTGPKVQGVAGVFWMKSNAFNEFDVLANILVPGGLSLYTRDDIDTKTWAAFADMSYNVTDAFNVNVGGRYTDDQRSATIFKRNYLGLTGSPTLGNPAAVGLPVSTDLGPNDLHRTDTKFTPKLGFGWKMSPEHNLYGTASQGFKGGMYDPRMDLGGNPNSAASLIKREGVNPEQVTAFELGVKSSLNGGTVQTNAAIFYTNYKDVQIPGSVATYDASGNINGFGGSLTNAGKAKVKGLELEAVAHVTNAFNVSGMYSYIDAKYDEWLVAAGPTLASGTGLVNIAPQSEFQNTPKHSANLSASYDWPMSMAGHSGSLSFRAGASYKSKVYQTELARTGSAPLLDLPVAANLMLAQDGYTLWDAGVVWTSSDRKIQVGLHGRNLTDKRYKVAGYNFYQYYNTVTTFYGDPRTVKLTVGLKF
ncbi:MAG TPA: TonB-dependent receptor [Telluria sp.]|nr:TonB-dependent receptor [Telluria sp.]